MSTKRYRGTLAAAVLAAVLALTALAQAAGPMAGGRLGADCQASSDVSGMRAGMMMGPHMRQGWVAMRTSELRTELKPTPEQAGAFDAYVSAVEGFAAAMPSMRGMGGCGAAASTVTAPDAMAAMVQHMQARLDATKAVQIATATLYQQLTVEQRAVLDRHAAMGMMGRGMMGNS